MKDAAIKAAKLLAINAGILIGSVMVLYLFSILIVLSIFNAIFTNLYQSVYAVNVFIRLCYPIISALVIWVPFARDTTARKTFLNTIGAEKYNRKEDAKSVIKTKEFYIGCVVFTIVNTVMFLIPNPSPLIFILAKLILPVTIWRDVGVLLINNPPQWIFLIAILVFPFINLWHHTAVRKRWARERIRFANEE